MNPSFHCQGSCEAVLASDELDRGGPRLGCELPSVHRRQPGQVDPLLGPLGGLVPVVAEADPGPVDPRLR